MRGQDLHGAFTAADKAPERQAKAARSFSQDVSPLDLHPQTPPGPGLRLGLRHFPDCALLLDQDTGRQRAGMESSPSTRFMNYSAWEASALRRGKGRDKENVQKVHKDKCL